MKNTSSLTKDAYKRIFLISTIFSLLLGLALVALISFSYRFYKRKEISETIQRSFSSLTNVVENVRIELIVKEIQQKTLLQSIFVFDHNCNLVLSTSLIVPDAICEKDHINKYSVRVRSDNQNLIIAFILENNLRDLIKANIFFASITMLMLFTVSFLFFVGFFKVSFLKPLSALSAVLESGKDPRDNFPRELDFMAKKLWDLNEQIVKKEEQRIYFELARSVVHDIRNPVAFMRACMSRPLNKDSFNEALQKIEYQIDKLLLKNKRNDYKILDLEKSLRKFKAEAEILFDLKVDLNINDKLFFKTPISEWDLNNILINMAKNSSEANSTETQVSISFTNNSVTLNISDNGTGFKQKDLDNIFQRNYSSKTNGNGIGLSSIKQFLRDNGGDIYVETTSSRGTNFKIIFAIIPVEYPKMIVLIDNEKLMHIPWTIKCKELGIHFHSFFSIHDFMKSCESIPSDTQIFIDSDLGNNLRGEVLSKEIAQKGFSNLTLCTSYDDIDIEKHPWIRSIINKEFPY